MISWNLKEYYVNDPSRKIDQLNTLEYDNGKITNICIDRIDNTFPNYPTRSIDKIKYSYIGLYPSSIIHYVQTTYTDLTSQVALCSEITTEDNQELFEYSNGNCTRYEAPNSGFSSYYYTIEYDTKNHYQSAIKPDAFKYILGRSTKNNMSKSYEYNSGNNQLNATIVFENTYNSNNFIIKAVEKYYNTGSTTTSVTTTINYLYY